ncbi:hypothetical protein M5E06_17750 [Azospirillum sp. A1-3]|uniref:hypothetical protein n=1 Tax=Azospirillum sp. A1-3 TaxID=185874 RepID=UPI0020771623|nr:hypothetical protein [Azospirillum sp. A1-3]MCM8735980.1 hypothetical protein [Azospirillum sp. A1-3]
MTNRYTRTLRRPGMPLFFKLWFALLGVLILSGFGAVIWIVVALSQAEPANIGASLGAAVRAFEQAREARHD